MTGIRGGANMSRSAFAVSAALACVLAGGCSSSPVDLTPYLGSWFGFSTLVTTPYLSFWREDGGVAVQAVSLTPASGLGVRDVRVGRVVSADPLSIEWASSDRLLEPPQGGPIAWSELPAGREDFDGPLLLARGPDAGQVMQVPEALALELGFGTATQLERSADFLFFPWAAPRDAVGTWSVGWKEALVWVEAGITPPPIELVPAGRLELSGDAGFRYFEIVAGVVSSLQGRVVDRDGRWILNPSGAPPRLTFPDGGSIQPNQATLDGTIQRAYFGDCGFTGLDGGCITTLVVTGFRQPYLDREPLTPP